jgi:molecular chaperone Hsp33
MSETDFLIRGLLKKENFRFCFADTTCTVTNGIKIHDTDPIASKILAEALTSAALLSPLLEKTEKYSIRWDYPHGELQGIIADVNTSNDVRGIIKQPHLIGKAETEDDIYGKENGYIAITKSDNGKILNSGKTRAGLANPASDTAFFFSVSDQIETEISVAVSFTRDPSRPVKRCCGIMLQAMPDTDLRLFEAYRERLNTSDFKDLLLKEMPIEKQLWTLLSFASGNQKKYTNSEDITYEFAPSPGFRCTCSRDKMKQALQTLGKKDLKNIIEQEEAAPKIVCQFCKKQYVFKKDELKDLI